MALDKLDDADHALWWQLTLAFLKIASTYWPARLEELKQSSPARHRNAILEAEAQRIASGKVTGPDHHCRLHRLDPGDRQADRRCAETSKRHHRLPGLDQTYE